MTYRIATLIAFTFLTACSGTPAVQDDVPTSATTAEPVTESQPYVGKFDARLTQFDYPYEVKVRTFEAQKQRLEMAYMDVAPTGEPNGKTVVLLHGKNFSGAYWERTIAALTQTGYRVVAPDQIGFGKSSKPANFQFTFHALATYTHDLLTDLGVKQATIVGHSMGGMLATRFALMFPDIATKLVLVNPIGLEDWQQFVGYKPIDHWHAQELKKTPEGVKAYMTKAYFDGQWKDEYAPLVELQAGWSESPDYPQIAWNSSLHYDMIYTQPVVQDFPRVTQPTLLIIGDRDRTALGRGGAPPEIAAKMGLYDQLGKKTAEAIPNAQLVELDGIGHIPQFEAYDVYIKALQTFLAR